MSIEVVDQSNSRFELYRMLDEGRAAVIAGKKRPLSDATEDIKQEFARYRVDMSEPAEEDLSDLSGIAR